jgi:hypothetical protein
MGRMQSSCVLKQVVHTVTIGLKGVNKRIHIIPKVSVDSLAFLLRNHEDPNLNPACRLANL